MLKRIPRPATPPGIEIYPPLEIHHTERLRKAIQEDMQLASADKIPWRQFLRAFSKLSISASQHSPNQITQTSRNSILSLSTLEESLDFLFSTKFLIDDVFDPVHPAVYDPTPYMAPRQDGCVDINLKRRNSLSPLGSQLELFKHVVLLLSNSFNTWEIAVSVVEFARELRNREFLATFFSSGEITAEIFAEKLLIPAVCGRNYPLVATLLDAGADINTVGYKDRDPERLPLLWHAIQACDEETVRLILHRASCLRESLHFRSIHVITPRFLLSFAIQNANTNIVVSITTYLQSHDEELEREHWEDSFTYAALRGDVEILKLLISKQTLIFEGLRDTPWILYESATKSRSIPMVNFLQTIGFDISAKSPLNQGSPLVHALLGDHKEMADYLIDAGSSIDSYPYTEKTSRYAQDRGPDKYMVLTAVESFAPIHAAIFSMNIPVLRRLIEKGADPNQVGIRFPIQMAACMENVEIARLLLEAGACIDFVSLPPTFYNVHHFLHWRYYDKLHFKTISRTPEQSAIQIALQVGDENMFKLLFHAGARLPTTVSCICMRLKDTLFNRHEMPDFISQGADKEAWTCSCEKGEIYVRPGYRTLDWDEDIWNPLLNAAYGCNQKLFTRVLDIAKVEGMTWMTTACITQCIRSFGVSFAKMMITSSTASISESVYCQLLLQAVEESAEDIVYEILQASEVNCLDVGNAYTTAVRREKINIVRKFLDFGFWPDDSLYVDSDEFREERIDKREWRHHASALRAAFEKGNESTLRLMFDYYDKLIGRAWEPDIRRHFRQAYGIAIRCGNMPMVQLLAVAAGIDNALYWTIDITCEIKTDVLHTSAVQLGSQFQQSVVVHWLLDQGAEPELSRRCIGDNALVNTPLQCASRDGEISVVRKLLDLGADVNAKPARRNGATALQFAAICGRFDLVNVLLNAGADLDAPPGYFEGRSAIEGAAEVGLLDMTKYLFDLGTDEGFKGAANTNYRRAVYRAWRHGHRTLARMLVKWKSENVGSYIGHQDSIEAIQEATELEMLLELEPLRRTPSGFLHHFHCNLCLPWELREDSQSSKL